MKFELEGYNLEELVKLLYRKKIVLKNIVRTDETHLMFETEDKDQKKVKRYIINYKAKTGLSKLKQLPKILLANLGIILGVFFGGLFYFFAGSFTWQIKIYGLEYLNEKEIITVLEQNGIKKGKINLTTSEEIETILLNNYDRIAQVSVIKQGTAIVINLSEKLVYNEQVYQPIIANFSGIITSVNISTGTTNVKVGDYVNKGDVLVLPFNLNANGDKVSVKPFAEINAKMFIVGSCKLNQKEKEMLPTGNKIVCYNYKLFNFNAFWGKNKNMFEFYFTKVYNERVSDLIPLSRQRVEYYELKQQVVNYNLQEKQEEQKQKSYDLALKQLPSNCKIIDKTTTSSILDNVLYANTIITVEGIINN